jgi:hypothetical protein
MSAMEALLVSRRTLAEVADKAAAQPAAASIMEAMKAPRVGAGAGAGNGYEILLQACTPSFCAWCWIEGEWPGVCQGYVCDM